MHDYFLQMYVINLRERTDKRLHIEEQFKNKPEFKVNFIEVKERPIGAIGLWQSIVKTVGIAIEHNDDIMIICKDDHTFTSAYSKEFLFIKIIAANTQKTELLSGGGRSATLERLCLWQLIAIGWTRFGVRNL
nr:hypothetical protein [uncultured Bacteroides sp.]